MMKQTCRFFIAAVSAFLLLFASSCTPDALLSPSAVSSSRSVTANGSELQIHVIDVGNADSILICNGDDSMLIDAGENNDGDDVVNYIHRQGITSLDYVIATHPDSDHIGGMDVVVKEIPVSTFIMSIMPQSLTPTTKTYMDLLEAMDKKGLSITRAETGSKYPLGEASFTILGPVGVFESTNNMSVVSRIDFGNRRFLFMGDAEAESEDALLKSVADLKADFIKTGHHGSHSSSQDKFIKAVSPMYAMITCGSENNYGHPHPKTLTTLKKYHVACYRSDLNGTVIFKSDGDQITVEKER